MFEWNSCNGTSANTYVKRNDMERCSDYTNFAVPFGPFVAVNVSDVSKFFGIVPIVYFTL